MALQGEDGVEGDGGVHLGGLEPGGKRRRRAIGGAGVQVRDKVSSWSESDGLAGALHGGCGEGRPTKVMPDARRLASGGAPQIISICRLANSGHCTLSATRPIV